MFTSCSHKRGRCGIRRSRWQQLNVVALEERNAPAQLIVTSAADDGGAGFYCKSFTTDFAIGFYQS